MLCFCSWWSTYLQSVGMARQQRAWCCCCSVQQQWQQLYGAWWQLQSEVVVLTRCLQLQLHHVVVGHGFGLSSVSWPFVASLQPVCHPQPMWLTRSGVRTVPW